MDDLIVSDEEYENCMQALDAFGEEIETQLSDYVSCLNEVHTHALTEGQASDNFKLFALSAEAMIGKTKEYTAAIKQEISSLLVSIDEADAYLYN